MGKSINELKAVINQLRAEVAELKSLNGETVEKSLNNTEFNSIVSEVMDRQRRSKNLIIYGIEESANGERDARRSHDMESVKSVLNFLSCGLSQVNPLRLGKYAPNQERPRPVKITLNDEETVHQIIRKANKLKGSQFENIRISLDRTPRQIESYKLVKRELDRRLASGERNLKIKTINGVPVIQSVN